MNVMNDKMYFVHISQWDVGELGKLATSWFGFSMINLSLEFVENMT